MNDEYISKKDLEDFAMNCVGGEVNLEQIHNFPAANVKPVVYGKNIGIEYDECDQFVCSECGIELQDWHRVERDEIDGEVTYHEYVFNFCPNCGADLRVRNEETEKEKGL